MDSMEYTFCREWIFAESDRLHQVVRTILDSSDYDQVAFRAAYQAEQAFNAEHHAILIRRPGYTFTDQ